MDWVVRRDLGSVKGGGELIETFDEDAEEVEGGVTGIAGAVTAAACVDRVEFVTFVFDCAAAAAAVGATERGGGAGVFCCCCCGCFLLSCCCGTGGEGNARVSWLDG